jgi:hypothetical protein
MDIAFLAAQEESKAFSNFLEGKGELTDEQLRKYGDVAGALEAAGTSLDTLKNVAASPEQIMSSVLGEHYITEGTRSLFGEDSDKLREIQQQYDDLIAADPSQVKRTYDHRKLGGNTWQTEYGEEAQALQDQMAELRAKGARAGRDRREYRGMTQMEANRFVANLNSDDLRRMNMTRADLNDIFNKNYKNGAFDQVQFSKDMYDMIHSRQPVSEEQLFSEVRNILGGGSRDKVGDYYTAGEKITREKTATEDDINILSALSDLGGKTQGERYGEDRWKDEGFDYGKARAQSVKDLLGSFDWDRFNRETGRGHFDSGEAIAHDPSRWLQGSF